MVLMTRPQRRRRECVSLPFTQRLEGSAQSHGSEGLLLGPQVQAQVSQHFLPGLRKWPAQRGLSSSGQLCSEAHLATGPSPDGNTYPVPPKWSGPRLNPPRAGAGRQARVDRWG